MTIHRLEVYLDSYDSKPFVRDFDDSISMSLTDERHLEDWICRETGRPVNIERQLKIEDVRHRNSSIQQFEATCLRVRLVQE